MKNKCLFSALLLTFSFLLEPSSTIVNASNNNIYLNDAKDIIELSEKCSYDAYSKDKIFILNNNISLVNMDFDSIPVFNGTFEGNGYKISGINITDSYSPCGFIGILGEKGTINNLIIEGSINPSGEKNEIGGIVGINNGIINNCLFNGTVVGEENVGGIAGYNSLSGTIKNSKFNGNIIGEKQVGGIVGNTCGLISSCINEGKVNTINITSTLDLNDLNSALTVDITKIPSFSSSNIEDIGGIAGYSTGYIQSSLNYGDVGYQHVGYNIGGIVGRNNGHLTSNVNYGTINGRKDVGGIVGQMEPYVNYNLSNDLLLELQKELTSLKSMVSDTLGIADTANSDVSNRLNNIMNLLDEASNTADDLINKAGNYGEDVIGEVNRGSEIVSQTISSLTEIMNQFPVIAENISLGFETLEESIVYMEEASKIGEEALESLEKSFDNISSAIVEIRNGVSKIDEGTTNLKNSLEIKDKQELEKSLNTIFDGLDKSVESINSMSESINEVMNVLQNAGWSENALNQFSSLVDELKIFSNEFEIIYSSVGEIKKNIDIYYDKIVESSNTLIEAMDYFIAASKELNEALTLLESGISKISEGMNKLYESIIIKDQDAVNEGTLKLIEGFGDLANATNSLSLGLSNLSSSLEKVDSLNTLFAEFDAISSAINQISSSISEISIAMGKISEGGSQIFSNIELDYNKADEGATLVMGGFNDLSLSVSEFKSFNKELTSGMESLKSSLVLLKEAIDVHDHKAIEASLDTIYDSLGTIILSFNNMTTTFEEMVSTMNDMKIWGDNFIDSLSEVCNVFGLFSDSISMIQDGVSSIRNNASFDLESASDGLELISQGIKDIINSTYYIEDSISDLKDVISKTKGISEQLNLSMDKMKEAFDYFDEASSKADYVLQDINDLMDYLNNVEPIQISTPNEEIKSSANNLYSTLKEIETELKDLNANVTIYNQELIKQIDTINNQFSSISDSIINIIYSIDDTDKIINDVSEDEVLSATNGKVFSCTNNGLVKGDINVGGIAGIMGLEYDNNPEEDLSTELSITQKREYQLKAIIHNSQNNGTIISKKDCSGGIVGKMDLGVVYGCTSYGYIKSESGNYVGGISGLTSSSIYDSFAKCRLNGNKYVGGIIGSGVRESYSGDSSFVKGCYSLVVIEKCNQYYGAIAGINYGDFSENYFISDTLAGINRVSYEGKAEKISFVDFSKRRAIPQEFTTFTLTFMADNQIVKTINFNYGDSFDISIYPPIPKKEGYYGVWENVSLENLHYDTTINVIYKPYITSISDGENEYNRPLFIVEGIFKENEQMSSYRDTNCQNDIDLEDNYFYSEEIKENWILNIPEDNNETHKIHYFYDENTDFDLYIYQDGEWIKVEYQKIGSYIVFDANGDTIEFAIVSKNWDINSLIIVGGGFLFFVSGLVLIACLISKKRKKKKIEKEIIKDNKFPIIKSKTIEEKLNEADEELLKQYKEICDLIASFENIKRYQNKKNISYKYKRKPIMKILIKGKTLNVYLPLSCKEFKESKYVFIDESLKNNDYPMRIRITSNRQLRYTKELINKVMENYEIKKKELIGV